MPFFKLKNNINFDAVQRLTLTFSHKTKAKLDFVCGLSMFFLLPANNKRFWVRCLFLSYAKQCSSPFFHAYFPNPSSAMLSELCKIINYESFVKTWQVNKSPFS